MGIQNMPALEEFYQAAWFIVIMWVLGILLSIGLMTFLVILIIHQSDKRMVRDLESYYNSVHDSFSTDCSNMIKRIESISKQNASYVQIFDSVQARFSSILKENDKQCYIAVNSLKKLIGDKEFKGIKPIIDSTRTSMEEFEKASIQLNNDLQALLKPEDECRSMSVALKEKFRSLKDKYDSNATALASLAPSFKVLFDHITQMFTDFEDKLNSADYTSAKNMLPDVERLIDAADKVMADLPYLNTLADTVIPKRIQELSDTYSQLEKSEYPLHHLRIPPAIEEMKKEVADCKAKLVKLSIKGVPDTFNRITMEINEYFEDFEKEKQAKILFDSQQSSIDSSTYQCEKQYANLRNSLPAYKEVYKIDSTYLDQINVIKDMIDDMSTKKRTLDSFINSSTKQPYTMLVTCINDLQQRVTTIQKAFDDFHDYLKELKSDSDRTYKFIRESYRKLKIAEFDLRKANIDALTETIKPRIDQGYTYISQLDEMLKVTPIDVMKLNSDYQEASNHLDRVFADLSDAIQNLGRAENLIVYDNRYRVDSLEARTKLESAERSFMEADFTRAATTAADIYKTESARKQ
jgi:septation ring formation regulator